MSDRYAPPDPRPALDPARRSAWREALGAAYARATPLRVVALFEKVATGVLVRQDVVRVLEGVGFAGDHAEKAHWKGARVPGREVSVSSREALSVMRVPLYAPGDNLIVEGFDLRELAVGQRIALGDTPSSAVILERSAAVHRPCGLFADRAGADAYAFAYAENARGIMTLVRRGGLLAVGDPIRLLPLDSSD